MTFDLKFTTEADLDLQELFDFVLHRELERGGNLDLAASALAAIRGALEMLRRSPFTCRKAAGNAFQRELVIPFGNSGYVALFEILDDTTIVIMAVRHQLEDDYH